MSKKIIVSLFIFVSVVMMNACSSLGDIIAEENTTQTENMKSFDAEDAYIMYALRAEEIGDSNAASELFQILYEKSGKKEYLYKALKNQIALKKNQQVIDKVDEVTLGLIDDFKLTRLKIIAMFQLEEYEQAQNIATALVAKSQAVSDYLLLSDLYMKEEKYDIALKYLEGAYVKNYDEQILDKMSIIMFVNLHRKKDAIAQLETHSRIKGFQNSFVIV